MISTVARKLPTAFHVLLALSILRFMAVSATVSDPLSSEKDQGGSKTRSGSRPAQSGVTPTSVTINESPAGVPAAAVVNQNSSTPSSQTSTAMSAHRNETGHRSKGTYALAGGSVAAFCIVLALFHGYQRYQARKMKSETRLPAALQTHSPTEKRKMKLAKFKPPHLAHCRSRCFILFANTDTPWRHTSHIKTSSSSSKDSFQGETGYDELPFYRPMSSKRTGSLLRESLSFSKIQKPIETQKGGAEVRFTDAHESLPREERAAHGKGRSSSDDQSGPMHSCSFERSPNLTSRLTSQKETILLVPSDLSQEKNFPRRAYYSSNRPSNLLFIDTLGADVDFQSCRDESSKSPSIVPTPPAYLRSPVEEHHEAMTELGKIPSEPPEELIPKREAIAQELNLAGYSPSGREESDFWKPRSNP